MVNCPTCKKSRYYGYYMTFRAEGKVALRVAQEKYDRLKAKLNEFEEEAGERGKEIGQFEKIFGLHEEFLPKPYVEAVKEVLGRFDNRCLKNPAKVKAT